MKIQKKFSKGIKDLNNSMGRTGTMAVQLTENLSVVEKTLYRQTSDFYHNILQSKQTKKKKQVFLKVSG